MADWIDTHAHLDDEQFQADRAEVIRRANQAGVTTLIAVGITAASSERCVELAREYPGVLATVGVHPNHAAEAAAGDWERILALAVRPGVTGIGETGLDRYWSFTPFEIQKEWFARHLELGRRLDRAVVIHCRDAEPDMLVMLREEYDRHGPIRGVMHSFCGSSELATACLEMGLYLSFSGQLTRKNAAPLRTLVANLPRDRLLVETDCPYLTPQPLKGGRNEPANVLHTARTLAEALGMELDALAVQTSDNARRLFGIA